ncbi:uncharacterized protein [Euphorbia lathyris]|uniref:uncharacterized protein isoform X2 n=1 Tax=Euphorbia lathyris TaxID=212925 RepID=UPI00331373FC
MDGRTEIGAVKEDLEGLTVVELFTSLFTTVEEVFSSREEKFKMEIQDKNRENELLVEKLQRFKKENGELGGVVTQGLEERDEFVKRDALQRFEKGCGELKELITRLTEERDGFQRFEKECTELKDLLARLTEERDGFQRFEKECTELKELVAPLTEERDRLLNIMKENEYHKKEIVDLRRKNCELEGAKLNADTEVDLCRGTIKGLDERVLSLEKGMETLRTLEKDPFLNLSLHTNAAEEAKMGDSDEKMQSETNPNPSGGSSHRKRKTLSK